MNCTLITPGQMEYGAALQLQERLVKERRAETRPDAFLLLEHAPVITLGQTATERMLLVPPKDLEERGISLFRIGRGGKITYHGPGQLVGYPILDLGARRAVIGSTGMDYVTKLEQVMLEAAAAFGVRAFRRTDLDPETNKRYVGVWADVGGVTHKLGAVGAQITSGNGKYITMHGFALNVQRACLDGFAFIDPCGYPSLPIVSLEQLVGKPLRMDEVQDTLASCFAGVFGYTLSPERN